MSRLRLHPENHLVDRIGWLRAAVLGANDGIVSTASLIVGVAAAAAAQNDVLLAAIDRAPASTSPSARSPTPNERISTANGRSWPSIRSWRSTSLPESTSRAASSRRWRGRSPHS
jgi:hypothetical protein